MKLAFVDKVKKMTEHGNTTSLITQENIQFKVLKEIDKSTFLIEPKLKIAKVEWNGQVSKETVTKLLNMGADSVEFYGYRMLIADRSDLVEFDTEARIWLKKFLQMRASRIASNVRKLAIINPSSAKGSIFSNFISSAISLTMPNLKMKKFKGSGEALDWLVSK